MTSERNPTRRSLADGRQIFYFDDAGRTRDHTARDTRELPTLDHSSRMRYDVLTGEWITVASHRMTRTHLPSTAECPLCPTNETRTPT